MTVYEIRDAATDEKKLLGYLFYYEKSKRFFAELLSSIDEWSAPFIFSGLVKKGIYSIDSEWTMKFVRQRIIPSDRQNLGSILKENRLFEYDEYRLLQISGGRCAQDELFLVKCNESDLAAEVCKRLEEKVRDVLPMGDKRVMVFFANGKARVIDIGKMYGEDRRFANVLLKPELFDNVMVSPGGNGIEWGEQRFISAGTLYNSGKRAPIDYNTLLAFVQKRVMDTTEAAALLNCTRQYIGQLSAKGKLRPIKSGSNNSLFLAADIEIESRSW